MSYNRIELPSNSFLLYAKLLTYCTRDIKHETFGSKVSEFVKDIENGLRTAKNDFLSTLAANVNKHEALKCLYGKITTDIKKNGRETVSFNHGSEIANCFEHVKLVYPNETSNGIHTFITEHLNSNFNGKEGASFSTSANATLVEKKPTLIDAMCGTTWYLYLQSYDASPKTRNSIISRLVLRINSYKDVQLFGSKEHHDFIGEIDPVSFSHSSIIVINLEKKQSRFTLKKLQLRFVLDEGIPSEAVFLGQYIYFESSKEIVSGAVVLENTLNHYLNHRPTYSNANTHANSRYFKCRSIKLDEQRTFHYIRVKLAYCSGWEDYIPREIAEYLSNKHRSFILTEQLDSYNLGGLSNFLKERPFSEEKYNAIIEYDCFLITPIGNLKEIGDKDYFKEINECFFKIPYPTQIDIQKSPNSIIESTKILQSININRVYYSPRVKRITDPDFSSDGDSQSIVSQDISAMSKSRFIIFIVPDLDQTHPHHTSSFIKIGWAMQQGKPIIIFPLAPNLLPKLLQSQIRNIHISDPVNIKDIPERLRNEYSQVLEP